MRINIIWLFFCVHFMAWSQEIRVDLNVSTELVDQTNITPVQTLEKSLRDFLNNTNWTNEQSTQQAEISISFLLNIVAVNDNSFSGTLQVQSGRLIYGSAYTSPLTNLLDNNFTFTYQEFQPLYFDVNRYNSNLVSVFSYYIYLVAGMELDSFAPLGGDVFYEQARIIANAAQASGAAGWTLNRTGISRYALIDQLSSAAFNDFRLLLYEYHRNALDLIQENPKEAKELIASQLVGLENLMRRQSNVYLLQAFFDTKSEEIGQIFAEGPDVDTKDLLSFLNRYVPTMSSYWSSIKR